MERRNNDELTPAQDAHADQTLRALLARHDQPIDVSTPPRLSRQIIAQLPQSPPAQAALDNHHRRRRRAATTFGVALLLVLLTALGAWGALVNSSSPALLFGGTATTLGYLVLVLVLSIKPLLGLLATIGTPTLATGALLTALAGWGWWQLAQHPLNRVYAEADL